MLVCNDKISKLRKHVKTTNIGIDKVICVKLNIGLTYNLVKNT